jgi:hypothetical protein
MRNASDKICRENQTAHFIFNQFFSPKILFYEIMSKNMVEGGRRQLKTWRTRTACWIPKAKEAHSEYLLTIAFLLQQWLHQRALMLRDVLPVLFTYKSIRFVAHTDTSISENTTLRPQCTKSADRKHYMI